MSFGVPKVCRNTRSIENYWEWGNVAWIACTTISRSVVWKR